jgi:hypothetical protein
MTGPAHSALRLVPDEPDQVPRLARFREERPGVAISEGLGYWQGCIPEPSGETVITRYRLRELLDKLDELTGNQPSGSAD